MAHRGPPALYEPLDCVTARFPLLPVEAYDALCRGERPEAAFKDPRIRGALAAGSPELLKALERLERGKPVSKAVRGKLLRYLIRMSTRPTPYGLFAAVALADWSDRTDMDLRSGRFYTRTRPDMGALLGLVMKLEADPMVRRHLRLVANPAALFRGGRIYLLEKDADGSGAEGARVSVRATGAVRRALAAARSPIPYERLAADLLAAVPGATSAKVDRMLGQLLEHTLLMTDLRPSVTDPDPARYVADRLRAIPPAAEEAERLEDIRGRAAAFDAGRSRDTAGLETDSAYELSRRTLGRGVGEDLARAVELMLSISPYPNGFRVLEEYRSRFEARYGGDRCVPLLELVDPAFGLGLPGGYSASAGAVANPGARERVLLELACGALRDAKSVVELDEKTIGRLKTWDSRAGNAPLSLDIYAFVCARSQEAVNAGEYQVVVGPNVGATAAGRNLGRFARMLGEEAVARLERAARAEEARAPEDIFAELVYTPRLSRLAGICSRPDVRRYEIALGAAAGRGRERAIPLDELVVGLENGRLCLRWLAGGPRVIVTSGHMLNYLRAPGLCRFLAETAQQDRPQFQIFDWGPASNFPFLPRVQWGRIVLRPAQWRIGGADIADAWNTGDESSFRGSLRAWRSKWRVPRRVYLSMGDNRLLLDLEHDLHAEELRLEARRAGKGGVLTLQEALPDVAHAWTPGHGGRYVAEFVVPLLRRQGRAEPPKADPPRRRKAATASVVRLMPPGSDWLYFKLYCGRELEDGILAGPVRSLAEEAMDSGLADRFFFVRYSDPAPHLRLRFRGDPKRLMSGLMPKLCEWGSRLIGDELCSKFGFDTYDREIERYGGGASIGLFETVFAADSRFTLDLLSQIQGAAVRVDRKALAAWSLDELLSALGLDPAARLLWCKENVHSRAEAGLEYRAHGTTLLRLLGGLPRAAGDPEAVDGLLARRRRDLSGMGERLRALEDGGELTQPLAGILRSIAHMHCNRLLGTDRSLERQAMGLFLRARQAMERPARPRAKAAAESA